MGAREGVVDLVLGCVDDFRAGGLDDDLRDGVSPRERVLDGRERCDGDVVLVLDAVRSLALEDADDAEVDPVQLDRLTERVLAGEQVRDDGLADHDDARVRVLVLAGEERPLGTS